MDRQCKKTTNNLHMDRQCKKTTNNLHMDSTYLQTVQKTMCKIHIHILSTQCTIKTYSIYFELRRNLQTFCACFEGKSGKFCIFKQSNILDKAENTVIGINLHHFGRLKCNKTTSTVSLKICNRDRLDDFFFEKKKNKINCSKRFLQFKQ